MDDMPELHRGFHDGVYRRTWLTRKEAQEMEKKVRAAWLAMTMARMAWEAELDEYKRMAEQKLYKR
ncbi:MAG: hypothetical protein HQL84_17105 [Magnetococcales bacterium]|nr:hypothetical protein [Magnetococcales bacterium]